jgi:hypothetical protein
MMIDEPLEDLLDELASLGCTVRSERESVRLARFVELSGITPDEAEELKLMDDTELDVWQALGYSDAFAARLARLGAEITPDEAEELS